MIRHGESRTRVVIEAVKPEIDGGRLPIKRITGDIVVVEADIFVDGYDFLSATLLYRKESDLNWTEVPMESLVNERWRESFVVSETGYYRYTIIAWVDRFKSWRQNLTKKFEAKQDVSIDLLEGVKLIREASHYAAKRDAQTMQGWVETLSSKQKPEKMTKEVREKTNKKAEK